jgi:hypothetical protein
MRNETGVRPETGSDTRASYQSPRLTVFGMVKSLTATGSAMGKEMSNIMAMG